MKHESCQKSVKSMKHCGLPPHPPLQITRNITKTFSAFRFRLYRLFSCLCFKRRRWLCDFPPKQSRVAFGLPYLLIELFHIGMPVVRTDGDRSVYGHVITKCSRMGSLPHFLTNGAPLARFVRESSAINVGCFCKNITAMTDCYYAV